MVPYLKARPDDGFVCLFVFPEYFLLDLQWKPLAVVPGGLSLAHVSFFSHEDPSFVGLGASEDLANFAS